MDNFDRRPLQRWMRAVMDATGWTAKEWGKLAHTEASNITRFLAKADASVPTFRTLSALASVAPRELPIPIYSDQDGLIFDPVPLPGTSPKRLPAPAPRGSNPIAIPRYDAALSAGTGSIVDPNAEPLGHLFIEEGWLRSITMSAPDRLVVVRVDGDSMEKTLWDGDWILVDLTQTRPSREGIYALRVDDRCWVKRITIDPPRKLIRVISDNDTYPMWEATEKDLVLMGRAIWVVARRI